VCTKARGQKTYGKNGVLYKSMLCLLCKFVVIYIYNLVDYMIIPKVETIRSNLSITVIQEVV
jgi:hypothetical protein